MWRRQLAACHCARLCADAVLCQLLGHSPSHILGPWLRVILGSQRASSRNSMSRQSNTRCYIITVALFLIAGFFMAPVSLRDEVLLVRGFVCLGTGFVTRYPEVRGHGRLELCKGTWSLRGPRWMAMARASLVRSSLAWLHVLQHVYRMMASAGVIIPAPSGGTPGRHLHGCLLSPSGHRAEHEVARSWTERSRPSGHRPSGREHECARFNVK